MSLIKRDTKNIKSLDPFREFDSFFDNFLSPMKNLAELRAGVMVPEVDISENGERYRVKADMPGINKDDIHVTLHDGVLTIEAETKEEHTEENEQWLRRQRRTGKYMTRFSLGDNVAEDDTVAEFADGVLTLTIPKIEPKVANPRKIDVK